MKRGIKIIHNRIRCKNCGEIIESKSRHDFVGCSCFKNSKGLEGCAVDGGHDYLRGIGDPSQIEELYETRPFTDEEVDDYNRQRELLAEQYSWIRIDYMEK